MRKRSAVTVLFCLLVMSWPSWVAADDPDGDCEENGPYYSEWYLGACPALNNSPSVNPTSFCGAFGDAPCIPTVVAPQYGNGTKYQDITYDCQDGETTEAGISWDVGSVKWDPPLPTKWGLAEGGTFLSTAYVDVTGGDDLCPPPGRYDIGTVTWNVYGPPVTTSSSVDFSGIEDALKELARFFSQGSVCTSSPPGSLEIVISKETSTICCNGCSDTTSGTKLKISGGGSLSLGSFECDFPFAGIPYVVTANININGSASISVTISGTFQCGNMTQICGNVTPSGTVGGGVSVIVGHPKLFKAALTLQGSVNGDGEICYTVDGGYSGKAKLCGSATVQGTITLFGGWKETVSVPLCNDICTPELSFPKT